MHLQRLFHKNHPRSIFRQSSLSFKSHYHQPWNQNSESHAFCPPLSFLSNCLGPFASEWLSFLGTHRDQKVLESDKELTYIKRCRKILWFQLFYPPCWYSWTPIQYMECQAFRIHPFFDQWPQVYVRPRQFVRWLQRCFSWSLVRKCLKFWSMSDWSKLMGNSGSPRL